LTIRSRCPDGGELRTYIAKLPKREHDTFARRAAIEALMLVVEHRGDTMLLRIGMMRALNRHSAKAKPAPRRKLGSQRTSGLLD
jgi:hypothetical protein